MNRSILLSLLAVVLLLGAAACADGEDYDDAEGAMMEEAPVMQTHDLTVVGDSTFFGPHDGQAVSAALLAVDGTVLATMTDTVRAGASPAFSITFRDAVTEGEPYMVNYWIDSNFGEGTEGVCDPPPADHQWSLAVDPVEGDVRLDQGHAPDAITDVCASFGSSDTGM